MTAAAWASEKQDGLITALKSDYTQAEIEPPDRVMLDYSFKLTATPGEMLEGDVQALREVGFDDRAIHDICSIVGYFAFVNRIADGLGVELDEYVK